MPAENGFVYRVQDAEGRGPWKPGFSQYWVEDRADLDNLPPCFIDLGTVHEKAFSWESVGCGCRTLEQLRRWFTESEYRTLIRYGYAAVCIRPSRILAESSIQCVFTVVLEPLATAGRKIQLYPSPQLDKETTNG